MTVDNIINQLQDKLRDEQLKNKCYIKGFEDGIAEVIFILEKNKKNVTSCNNDCNKQ